MALSSFLTILATFGAVVLLLCFISLHKIEEGYVGVYFRGGALLPGITEPGYHVMFPFITSYEPVQVSVQTDKVRNIPCGTSGGVLIYFDNIEVVNRLSKNLAWETIRNYTVNYDKTWIFDKIHHEINQFCSKHTLQEVYITLFDRLDDDLIRALQRDCNIWAPGMEIISIRVTKPRIPPEITANYERMEIEKIKQKIALEQQRTSETLAETKRLEATIQAQLEAEVSRLRMEKELNETRIQGEVRDSFSFYWEICGGEWEKKKRET